MFASRQAKQCLFTGASFRLKRRTFYLRGFMEEEKFIFEWVLDSVHENIIIESIPKNNYQDYLRENGTIAEEISLACMVKNLEQKSSFFAFNPVKLLDDLNGYFLLELKAVLNNYLTKEHLTRENYITINFDVLEKIVFAYVFYICEESSQGEILPTKNDKVIRIINEIFSLSLNIKEEDSRECFYPYNEKDFGLSKFQELMKAIEKSSIPRKYITFHKDRKCIALYKKWFGKELTVAFSGHHDCIGDDLYKFFVVSEKNRHYADYEKIAKAIGANLAGTSYYISRYRIVDTEDCKVERYDLVKDIMYREKQKDDHYSCCERKIFAYLDNRDSFVYSGKLFVKYSPCRECSLSILYHVVNKEKIFMMKVGLPI